MDKKLWWHYLKSIVLVMRVIAFEKYAAVAAGLWWAGVALFALMLYGAHYGASLAVVALGMVLYGKVQGYLLTKKYLLIRKGDTVEYVLPDEKDVVQQFSSATVLRRMRPADVTGTSLFNSDHPDLYGHFYLVDIGTENTVIPYEWIISIEAGELEL